MARLAEALAHYWNNAKELVEDMIAGSNLAGNRRTNQLLTEIREGHPNDIRKKVLLETLLHKWLAEESPKLSQRARLTQLVRAKFSSDDTLKLFVDRSARLRVNLPQSLCIFILLLSSFLNTLSHAVLILDISLNQ